MKIPNKIRFNNRIYIFIKEYERFVLYKDEETGSKQCFSKQELGLVPKLKEEEKWGARLKGITGLRV